MAYGRSNPLGRGLVRIVIAFGVIAIVFTIMGMIDLGKDAFGSHKDFTEMESSEFRAGDIVHGTIAETLGCAATITTTETVMYLVETDKYTSAAYYVVPFFDSIDDAFPNKILLYKTGNKVQMSDLEALTDETMYWYAGERSGTATHINVDRAEITDLSGEERDAFYDYVEEFVELYYDGASQTDMDYIKLAYQDAIVPYLVQYNAGGGSLFLTVGLVMLGIFIIGLIIILLRKKRADSTPQVTYVGPTHYVGSDPNLNSPTGLKNASDMFYNNNNAGSTPGAAAPTSPAQPQAGQTPAGPGQQGVPPYIAAGTARQQGLPPYMQNNGRTQPTGYRSNYSSSERPMPPINQTSTGQKREMNFDPYTGKPIEKRTLVDATFGTPNANRGYARGPQQNRQVIIKSEDSMPSVDPKTEENVDFSNGGISWEEKAQRNMSMPKNGNIPVINPEGNNAATMFGEVIPVESETRTAPAEQPEPEPELVNGKVTEIHPPTKEDNIKSDFQVEQTDPETRNIYSHMAGGQMHEVDPYTEKNVDVSNGGIELPQDESSAESDLRRSFDGFVQQQTAPVQQTASVQPIAPAPEPVQSQPDDYNIFKTGGDSYNIFKDSAPKTDSAPNMGFPVENKEFPKVDTSFPDAGKSDVGGKDDFIF